MSRAWVLLGGLLAACLQPSLVECPDDLICPIGRVCDPAHHTCVLPEQLQSCRGMANDKSCLVAGTVGYCRDEVCLPISCGNGIVDLTEVCDDGNLSRGDGCNATCSSDESCGNGTIDSVTGEQCDDANRIDGDACDSRCRNETETWTVQGLGLHGDGAGKMAYDQARHQAVYVTQGTTWTYDGTRWSLASAEGPPRTEWSFGHLEYDPDTQRVVLLGRTLEIGSGLFAYNWDGTVWTPITLKDPPRIASMRMVYDPLHHAILVVGSGGTALQAWLFDPATGEFTEQSQVTSLLNGVEAIAFDSNRNRIVVAQSNNIFEWSGTTWTRTIVTSQPVFSGFSMVFDPRENAIIAVGGQNGGPTTTVMKWPGGGTQWIPLPAQALPLPRNHPSLVWDSDRQLRVAFGGSITSGYEQNDTFEWNGTAWTHVPSPDPLYYQTTHAAYDPVRRALIQIGGGVADQPMDVWIFDANRWHRAPTAPFLTDAPGAVAYDPVRRGFVYNSAENGTFLFIDDQWIELEPEPTSAVYGFYSMTYDPSRKAVVGIGAPGTWMLESSGTAWQSLPPAPAISSFETLAYDARSGNLVAGIGENVFELDASGWSASLSPGPFFDAVADPRRGSVLFIRGQSSMWELLDGVWFERFNPIVGGFNEFATYSAIDGKLLVVTELRGARLMYERAFVGPAPRDTCAGGDEDGDGLVDCADDDCWWSCTPACPPFASCP